MESALLTTAMTANQMYPASIAAPNRKTFPMKPAVGGMPPRDNMKNSMATAATGLRRYNPLRSLSSSPMTSWRRISAMMVNAPSCMKTYRAR